MDPYLGYQEGFGSVEFCAFLFYFILFFLVYDLFIPGRLVGLEAVPAVEAQPTQMGPIPVGG